MSRALVIAHRGASDRELENSLAAFRAAAALGADAVELDVHAAADGTLIVHHDATIAGRHHIPALSGRAVRELRLANGEPPPTLDEALAAAGAPLPPRFDGRLLDALRRGPNPAGYAVHGFDHRIVQRLGTAQPTLRRGILSASYPVRPLVPLGDAGATMLWQERSLVDRALADALHAARAELIVWTADDPEEIERLLGIGVDGVCTNHVDVGRRAVDAGAA